LSVRPVDIRTILLLGGTSEIGGAIVSKLAAPTSATVVLAGRRLDTLELVATRLVASGAGRVETRRFDADDTDAHEGFIAEVAGAVGDIDVVVLAFGVLGDQAVDEAGGDGAVRVAHTNFVGAVSVSLCVSRLLRAQGHGTLVVLSSVAGERVRRANFIYGSTKAGLDGFAQGLGDSLLGSGASVLIVRPGFVATKMTAGRPPAPLATTADAVAEATARGLAAGRPIVWAPSALRVIFAVFRHLPRAAWRRIST
jgi:decaprenylphospho-beta-D-erythro-pentofuranosid-2-ulose 2-reductase